MKIRPFTGSVSEYARIVELNRQIDPGMTLGVEQLQATEKAFSTENRVARFLGEIDGKLAAIGLYWLPRQEPNSPHQFSMTIHPTYWPSAIPRQIHDFLLERIAQEQPVAITSQPKEDELYRTRLLEESGFALIMRFPRSMLDVASVDCAGHEPLLARLHEQGIRFVTLSDVIQQDPDWQHNIWRMFTAIDRDIPSPEPYQETPFEEYAEYYSGDDYRPDSWAIAIDSTQSGVDQYIGMCVVNIMSTRPDSLFAGITGVVADHRRRKIATALKVCSVAYAQKHGYRTIYTNNEEHNPMYKLNRQLGFQPLPAWVYYRKEIN